MIPIKLSTQYLHSRQCKQTKTAAMLCRCTWGTLLTYCQDTVSTLHRHVLPFPQNEYKIIFIDWNGYWWAAEVCTFFFCGHNMKKEWRNLFKVYCWRPNSETVNPAKLRKDQWGTTLIPVHAKRNWCHVQSSNLFFNGKHIERFQWKSKCFSELMSRKLEHLKLCLEMDLITSCWPGLCIWQLKKNFLVTAWCLH